MEMSAADWGVAVTAIVGTVGIIVAIIAAIPGITTARDARLRSSVVRETLLRQLRKSCSDAFLIPSGLYPLETWRDEHANIVERAKQLDVAASIPEGKYDLFIEILEGISWAIDTIEDFRSESPPNDKVVAELTADTLGIQYEQALRMLGDSKAADEARRHAIELQQATKGEPDPTSSGDGPQRHAAHIETITRDDVALLEGEANQILHALKADGECNEIQWHDMHTRVEARASDISAKLTDDWGVEFSRGVGEAALLLREYPFESRQPCEDKDLRERFVVALRAYATAVYGLGDNDATGRLRVAILTALSRH